MSGVMIHDDTLPGYQTRPLRLSDLTKIDGSTGGGAVPVSGPLTDAQLRASLVPVDVLGAMGAARSVAMGASSANVVLTTTCRRVSVRATVAGFFAVGTGAQTASATSHYIGEGERLDFDVAANTQIAAIRQTSDGTLYISELV